MKKNIFDIAVLTSVPIEVLAALKIFSSEYDNMCGFASYCEKEKYLDALYDEAIPPVFHVGHVNGGDKKYNVLIYQLRQYGSRDMASAISIISERWNPHYYFLIGIAMAFSKNISRGNDISLGDIIIADKAICDSDTRHVEGKKTIPINRYELNIDLFKSTKKRINQAGGIEIEIEYGDRKYIKKPRIHQGCIHSSDVYLASTEDTEELYKRIKDDVPLGHEMELSGILSGANTEIGKIKDKLVFVKGISDYGDDKKSDTVWRYVAATHSALFVREIITEGSLNCSNSSVNLDEEQYHKLTKAEFKNWLGEMQYQQGLYKKAEPNFDEAWRLLMNSSDILSNKQYLLSSVAKNISKIKLEKGKISEALNKSMIALQLSTLNIDQAQYANRLLSVGKILREAEIIPISSRFLLLAKKTNDSLSPKDEILEIQIMLWEGYVSYKQREYLKAYNLINCSYKSLCALDPENKKNRVLFSEINDKLGRCVREYAKSGSSSEDILDSPLPKMDKKRLVLEALHHFFLGFLSANKEGNYYRLAESYLSYVILFSYKELQASLEEILNDIESSTKLLASFKGEEENFKPNFLSIFEKPTPRKNATDFFKKGISLCDQWDYSLLKCMFLKHRADYLFNAHEIESAFEILSERYIASFGDKAIDLPIERPDLALIVHPRVRPQEMYIAFAEINERLLNYRHKAVNRKRYFSKVMNSIADIESLDSNLFTEDYFKTLYENL
ncbi:hypothetical protein LLG10_02230 [bacterium]|nr:hypothetical protein [bacterium]